MDRVNNSINKKSISPGRGGNNASPRLQSNSPPSKVLGSNSLGFLQGKKGIDALPKNINISTLTALQKSGFLGELIPI